MFALVIVRAPITDAMAFLSLRSVPCFFGISNLRKVFFKTKYNAVMLLLPVHA